MPCRVLMMLTLAVAATSAAGQPPLVLGAEDRQSHWSDLRRLMSQRVDLFAREEPLEKVLPRLEVLVGRRFLIDRLALDDLGIGTDEPVSVAMRGAMLASVLDAMLRPLELTWTYQNESIVITTVEEDEVTLTTRVYAVGDLLGRYNGMPDYGSLIDVIVSTVAPETWAENGGGESEVRPYVATESLVVSQTVKNHLRIENLLDDLRRTGLPSPATANAGDSSSPRPARRRTFLNAPGVWLAPRTHDEPSVAP